MVRGLRSIATLDSEWSLRVTNLNDPPFSRMDLIICRNVLIYFEPQAQDKCISLFHYALKDGGYLFLVMRNRLE